FSFLPLALHCCFGLHDLDKRYMRCAYIYIGMPALHVSNLHHLASGIVSGDVPYSVKIVVYHGSLAAIKVCGPLGKVSSILLLCATLSGILRHSTAYMTLYYSSLLNCVQKTVTCIRLFEWLYC